MSVAKWGGRRAARLVALCLATYGTDCHLAGPMCAGVASTADHLLPRSAGGADTLANLRPACTPCNMARSDMPLDEWRRRYPSSAPSLTPSRPWAGERTTPDRDRDCSGIGAGRDLQPDETTAPGIACGPRPATEHDLAALRVFGMYLRGELSPDDRRSFESGAMDAGRISALSSPAPS